MPDNKPAEKIPAMAISGSKSSRVALSGVFGKRLVNDRLLTRRKTKKTDEMGKKMRCGRSGKYQHRINYLQLL